MKGFERFARTVLLLAVLGAALVVAAAAGGANSHANYHAVCPAAVAAARCHAQVVTDSRGNPRP
jgi:hypothetical protein